MSGYPHGPSGYGYGAPPAQPYAAPSPYGAPQQGHGQPPPQQGHGQLYAPPQSGAYGAPSAPYGASSAPYGAPSAPYGAASAPYKPPKDKPQQPHAIPSGGPPTAVPYGSPFASLLPSSFPPGTDPSVVACFQVADSDGSGFIDDKELQRALSSYNQSFSMRTVHLLMYLFTNTNTRKIG